MLVYAVITVGRQIDGEMVFIKTEKAFKSASRADEMVKKLNASYREGDKYKPIQFNTEYGNVDCYCTAGGFDLEVED